MTKLFPEQPERSGSLSPEPTAMPAPVEPTQPKLVYLASPYSHPDPFIRAERYGQVVLAAASMMAQGYVVFSPIAHSHHVGAYLPDGTAMDHDFWMRQDLPILDRCDLLAVLMLPGWDQSRGVCAEVAFANHRSIPIEFFTLNLERLPATVIPAAGGARAFAHDWLIDELFRRAA